MRKRCKNADEGVVLVAIQIAVDSDLSTERTVPPRSTHVQPDDVSRALIQQGEREKLGKTPSSSSTTAWWWWSCSTPSGLRQALRRRRMCWRARGRHQRRGLRGPPSPTIYREPRGGAGPRRSNLLGGRRPREESLLPKAPRRCLPPLGLFPS